MDRNKTLAVVIVVLTLTFSLLVIGTNLSQSPANLRSDLTASGTTFVPMRFTNDTALNEFTVSVKESAVNLMELSNRYGGNIGMFFPKLYNVREAEKGLVAIAWKSLPLTIEKSLRIRLKYDAAYMQYLGDDVIQTGSGQILKSYVSLNTNELMLEIQNTDIANPLVIPETSEFMQIPFSINPTKGQSILKVQIIGAESELRNGQIEKLRFDSAQFPLFGIIDKAGFTPSRVALTAEAVRTTPVIPTRPIITTPKNSTVVSTGTLLPITQTNQNTNTVVIPARETLRVTTDRTSISPIVVKEKSRETVFVYVSILDSETMPNVAQVTLDAKEIGIANTLEMIEIEKKNTIRVFATSFILPDSAEGRDLPYELSYTIRDTSNQFVTGSLLFRLDPADSINAGSSIDTDVNHDGKVDVSDLTLFLDAYKKATK